MNVKFSLILLVSLLMAGPVAAETTYQPFVLASVNDAGLAPWNKPGSWLSASIPR